MSQPNIRKYLASSGTVIDVELDANVAAAAVVDGDTYFSDAEDLTQTLIQLPAGNANAGDGDAYLSDGEDLTQTVIQRPEAMDTDSAERHNSAPNPARPSATRPFHSVVSTHALPAETPRSTKSTAAAAWSTLAGADVSVTKKNGRI